MLPFPTFLRHPQGIAAVATGSAAVIGVTLYLVFRRKLTPAEREERRRTRLAAVGRIIDGTLIDTTPEDAVGQPPHALIYRYRVSGVTYECGQDVSMLTTHVPDFGSSSAVFGMPVQVRYDRDNPADSIVIAETWNGLWNRNAEHDR
jgi:hypothetical protein